MDVLSEIIECSVCMERMDTKSKVLPCQHTFCSDCLLRISAQNKNELKCPECRSLCTIPVKSLPANILLVRLLEGLKTAGKPVSSKKEILQHSGTPCAKAMYSYDPQEPGDLRFRRGDLIYLKKKLDENWFMGEKEGRSGYLPATYVQVICPIPSPVKLSPPPLSDVTANSVSNALNSAAASASPVQQSNNKVTVRALYDFEMKDEEKEDCLKFKKDDVIQLIRRVDHNWAEGRLAGIIGIFPLNYVKVTETAKLLLDSPIQHQRSVRTISSTAVSGTGRSRNVSGPPTYANIPDQCSELSTHRLSDPVVACRTRGSNLPQSAANNTTSAAAEPNNYISIPGSGGITAVQQTISSSAPNTESDYLNLPPLDLSASVANNPHRRSRSSDSVLNAKLSDEESTTPNNTQHKISIHDLYRASYNYKPSKEDELMLTRGSLYHVSDRCKDGWYRGKCLRTGNSGVFPGNYVQLVPPDHTSDIGLGDAQLTMKRGRLEPPTNQIAADKPSTNGSSQFSGSSTQSHIGSSSNTTDPASRHIEDGRRFWGMDVVGCPAPAPKMRNAVRRNQSMNTTRERRRSSSLSRLESQSASVIQSHDQVPQPIRGRSGKSTGDKSSAPNKPAKQTRMRYKCVMAYPAQGDLELDMKAGDIVVVLKKKSEGWYKGTNETTGKSGIFPACFVQSCPSQQTGGSTTTSKVSQNPGSRSS